MYSKEACKSDMARSTIKKIHKFNEKISNKGSSRLTEQVPIQRQIV